MVLLCEVLRAIFAADKLRSGQGSLIGTLIGALILGNLSNGNGTNLLGIGTVYQFIVEGAVLVVAVVLDLTLKGNGLRIKSRIGHADHAAPIGQCLRGTGRFLITRTFDTDS